MENLSIKFNADKSKLTVEIDLTAERTRSVSGKSDMIASTHGNLMLADGIRLGLNCYVAHKGPDRPRG